MVEAIGTATITAKGIERTMLKHPVFLNNSSPSDEVIQAYESGNVSDFDGATLAQLVENYSQDIPHTVDINALKTRELQVKYQENGTGVTAHTVTVLLFVEVIEED